MTKKEQDRDKRLRKTYGITLDQYNTILEAQGGKCAICGKLPKNMPLNVDHFHFKITTQRDTSLEKINLKWKAIANIPGSNEVWSKTKEGAIQIAKERALPLSIRGLLCPGRHGIGCNTKLGRVDKIEWLESAINYLKNPPSRVLNS